MSLNKWHRLKEQDRARINCEDCPQPADVCEHATWDTGNTKGISFWYYCHPCAVKRSGNGLLADCMEEVR